jgi:hypothetical protein
VLRGQAHGAAAGEGHRRHVDAARLEPLLCDAVLLRLHAGNEMRRRRGEHLVEAFVLRRRGAATQNHHLDKLPTSLLREVEHMQQQKQDVAVADDLVVARIVVLATDVLVRLIRYVVLRRVRHKNRARHSQGEAWYLKIEVHYPRSAVQVLVHGCAAFASDQKHGSDCAQGEDERGRRQCRRHPPVKCACPGLAGRAHGCG